MRPEAWAKSERKPGGYVEEGLLGQNKQQEAKAGTSVAGFRDGKEILGLEQRSGKAPWTYEKGVYSPQVLDHCTSPLFLTLMGLRQNRTICLLWPRKIKRAETRGTLGTGTCVGICGWQLRKDIPEVGMVETEAIRKEAQKRRIGSGTRRRAWDLRSGSYWV